MSTSKPCLLDPVKALLLLSVTVLLLGILFFRPSPPAPTAKQLSITELTEAPPLADVFGDKATLSRALDQTKSFLNRNRDQTAKFGDRVISNVELLATVEDLQAHLEALGLSEPFYEYVRTGYRFFKINNPTLATGYYEPELRGSLTRHGAYQWPLYRVPSDLLHLELKPFNPECQDLTPKRARVEGKTVIPYYDRRSIDINHALEGRGLELVWVADPIDLFFLHIQGSGIITLEDGTAFRVGYGDKNGHPYRAIGKVLLERGLLQREQATMPGIKSLLRSKPELVPEILAENPSYIFFEPRSGEPVGSSGAHLTPYRSIATDARIFPPGALMYLSMLLPPEVENSGVSDKTRAWSGLALNQDTGGAILGPGRFDLFTGHGARSEAIAGALRQPAEWYLLLKKVP